MTTTDTKSDLIRQVSDLHRENGNLWREVRRLRRDMSLLSVPGAGFCLLLVAVVAMSWSWSGKTAEDRWDREIRESIERLKAAPRGPTMNEIFGIGQ